MNHPDEDWLLALTGGGEPDCPLFEQLSLYIRRVLIRALSGKDLGDEALAELYQEAMHHVLESLNSFRGNSSFPTWAAVVATRVAYTRLQRREADRSMHSDYHRAESDALERATQDDSTHRLTSEELSAALRVAIDSELTDPQRIATLAFLRGVPIVEIADQFGTATGDVYDLVHDARLRLRAALRASDVGEGSIEEADKDGAGG